MTSALTAGLRAWNSLESSDRVAVAVLLLSVPVVWTLARQRRRRAVHVFWTLALIAMSVPFGDLHGHTHWAKVGWIPFVTPPVKISDVAANILLYTPFGASAPIDTSRAGRTVWRTLLVAAGLSLVIETTQLFSHTRFPSFTDVTCDALGAALGAWGMLRFTRERAKGDRRA